MIKLDESELLNWIKTQEAFNQNMAQRLAALEKPAVAVKLPYPNFENSKYTFPDNKEYPALDVMKMSSEYIKFNANGSITYNLPAGLTGTPTANAKFLRIERREYKNMPTKSNYKKGDIISRSVGVTFHKLNLGTDDVVFSQVHGTPFVLDGVESDTPYFKMVAGKNGVRMQVKSKWNLAKDDIVIQLLNHADLKQETEYLFNWTLDGTTLKFKFGPTEGTILFDRPDDFYPKDGAYGPVGVSLTHRAV